MKIITVNIRSIILGITAFCIVLCLILVLISANTFATASTAQLDKSDTIPIYRVTLQEGDKRIAITFDNAWGADDIPEILAALKKHNAKATFFVLGTWAEKFPDMVQLIHEAGHELANHSYAHKKPTRLSESDLKEEITKGNDVIRTFTGTDNRLYRAPYGDYNEFVVRTVNSMGMYMIQWDVDSLDWKPEMTEEAIYKRVTERVKEGSIILFHNDTKHTKNILPEILETLTSQGYVSVTVSELIYKDEYGIDNAGEQYRK